MFKCVTCTVLGINHLVLSMSPFLQEKQICVCRRKGSKAYESHFGYLPRTDNIFGLLAILGGSDTEIRHLITKGL